MWSYHKILHVFYEFKVWHIIYLCSCCSVCDVYDVRPHYIIGSYYTLCHIILHHIISLNTKFPLYKPIIPMPPVSKDINANMAPTSLPSAWMNSSPHYIRFSFSTNFLTCHQICKVGRKLWFCLYKKEDLIIKSSRDDLSISLFKCVSVQMT